MLLLLALSANGLSSSAMVGLPSSQPLFRPLSAGSRPACAVHMRWPMGGALREVAAARVPVAEVGGAGRRWYSALAKSGVVFVVWATSIALRGGVAFASGGCGGDIAAVLA